MKRSLAIGSAVLALSCTSGGTGATVVDDAGVVVASTSTCAGGDVTRCLRGAVTAKGFTVPFASAKVELYSTFPYGRGNPLASTPLNADGTFAFADVAPGALYYVQAVARFGTGAQSSAVASIAGPFAVPTANTPIELTVRPVFLEVLQQKPTNGAAAVGWASAHVFDPASGRELTDATVAFHVGAQRLVMPFGPNISGAQSYFVQAPKGTPAATDFTIDVTHPAFATPATFTLKGEIPAFDAVLESPADGATINVGQSLEVRWKAEPSAAFTLVQLYVAAGSTFTSKYTSAAPRSSSTTKETIPASAIDGAAKYLLNVQLTRPTCPTTADGCVYNASTAISNLDAK